ncbi:PLP-dependent aminotransferase family protein [Gracilibacillus oryzae]|uniref:PLP-dependent aminotransferase family protein n=1 Tax=Gracilibacillus oryzae TaxID=1672701 RepID=A0A7C8KWD4_9BACI|nr:PLP-dependent aminotransferase family protein [Gracilibacillus oryzae]KAB8125938.1 PLP-dependent aminotransferase family protein [Gracilibacillus oryzae]
MKEITPFLDQRSNTPIYIQLSHYFKNEIIKGKIKANEQLPSKRTLAKYLDISLNTVQSAYDQLRAEGYIESKERKGMYVQPIDKDQLLGVLSTNNQRQLPQNNNVDYLIDFNSGRVDLEHFPYNVWRKLTTEALYRDQSHLFNIGDPQGELSLRTEIASYLYQSRGVNCNPEQIIIAAGTQPLVGMLAILIGRSNDFAIEDPGFHRTKQVLDDYGIGTIPVSLDQSGLSVDSLRQSKAKAVYVTPSHQFPCGMIMPISRRLELLKWAEETGGYIIEDDYDGEYRYKGRPIPSLQGLDRHDCVIYLGTFSKALIPSIRVSYVVLPTTLVAKYHSQFTIYKQTVSRLHQDTLCRFMNQGYWQRHLNRMRTLYRKKQQVLLTAIGEYMGDSVQIVGEHAGLHILLTVKNGMKEEELIESAAKKRVKVYPTSIYYNNVNASGEAEILLGFGGLPVKDIEEGIRLLKDAWVL